MTTDEKTVRATGGCLCGGVRYEITGPMRPVVACHCTECRRFSGGLWHASAMLRENLTIEDGGSLRWYNSSTWARRGFCVSCGASLFFDSPERPYIGVAAGTLNDPTGLTHAVHIFTREAGDYYRLDDALPKHPDGQHGLTIPES